MDEATLAKARGGDEKAFHALVAPHQRELRAYCYRMSGSLADADDLVQECLLRAWRGLGAFEGRSSLRTWLYRVAWSACVDSSRSAQVRKLTVETGPPADPTAPIPPPTDDWIGPCPATFYASDPSDVSDAERAPSPEARYSSRESVALAFLAALQLLPPKQRATLLARDVLGWSAEECAELLESSVASANSALQRARETLEAKSARWRPRLPDEETTKTLLAKYVTAWEQADVGALVSLLHDDATLAMPPLPIWLSGPRDIGASVGAMVLRPESRGLFRFVRTEANGLPALAAYKKNDAGVFEANALHLVEPRGDRVAAMTAFLDPRLFAAFGLAPSL